MTARWAGRKGRPWRTLRAHVLARDGRVCGICGHYITDDQPGEVDHLHRRADGGSNTDPDNFQASHGSSSLCWTCDPARGWACNQRRRTPPTTTAITTIIIDLTTL